MAKLINSKHRYLDVSFLKKLLPECNECLFVTKTNKAGISQKYLNLDAYIDLVVKEVCDNTIIDNCIKVDWYIDISKFVSRPYRQGTTTGVNTDIIELVKRSMNDFCTSTFDLKQCDSCKPYVNYIPLQYLEKNIVKECYQCEKNKISLYNLIKNIVNEI